MIAVDTNVLLRAFVEDDPRQSHLAQQFLTNAVGVDNPAWVATIVLAEMAWLPRNRFGFNDESVRDVIARLLGAVEVVVENRAAVLAALASEGIDFTDALVHASGQVAGCSATVTFDRKFARQPGVELLA